MRELANRLYKRNTGRSFKSVGFMDESQIRKNVREMESRRQKRMEESSNEYRQKRQLKRRAENKARLKAIRSDLSSLSDYSEYELRIILLINGVNPNRGQYELIRENIILNQNKNKRTVFIDDLYDSEMISIVKTNLSKFDTLDLCKFLDINPELNFSKKGQLVHELFEMIKESLSSEYEKTYLINSQNMKSLTKRVFLDIYRNS